MHNTVFVQASPYGTDNRLVLDSLRGLERPEQGRGVVVVDPARITVSELREWHDLGVRALRINLVSVGRDANDAEGLQRELEAYADVIKNVGRPWVLQLYVPLAAMAALEAVVPTLGVKVCVDHFGSPTLPAWKDGVEGEVDPYSLPGFGSLVNLMRQGGTWCKVSGWYRLSRDPEGRMRDLGGVVRELLKVRRGSRVVWASDWPHTRFEGVNVGPFVDQCWEWCEQVGGSPEKGGELMRRLCVDNAEELWDAE